MCNNIWKGWFTWLPFMIMKDIHLHPLPWSTLVLQVNRVSRVPILFARPGCFQFLITQVSIVSSNKPHWRRELESKEKGWTVRELILLLHLAEYDHGKLCPALGRSSRRCLFGLSLFQNGFLIGAREVVTSEGGARHVRPGSSGFYYAQFWPSGPFGSFHSKQSLRWVNFYIGFHPLGRDIFLTIFFYFCS